MSLPEPELDLETEVAPSDLPSSIFEVGLVHSVPALRSATVVVTVCLQLSL